MGEARRPALVVNAARVADVRRLCRACERATVASGWRAPLVLSTTPAEAGSGLTRHALAAGADLVIVAGGDGTVRACAEVLAGTGVPLAIVPSGSANLTANALGVPLRPDAALRVAFGGRDRQIDLALADGMTFAAMAGIGLDAAVVGATPDTAKRLAGGGGCSGGRQSAAGQASRVHGPARRRGAHDPAGAVGDGGEFWCAAWRLPDHAGGAAGRRAP